MAFKVAAEAGKPIQMQIANRATRNMGPPNRDLRVISLQLAKQSNKDVNVSQEQVFPLLWQKSHSFQGHGGVSR